MTVQNKTTGVEIFADYFIHKNINEPKGLSNKKLQKLLYYAQAWSMVVREKPLFKEEIEAWIHGPAIPCIYEEYKQFGFLDICKKVETATLSSLQSDEKMILDAVWEIYGKYDGDYLETLTHSELPWQEARKNILPFQPSNSVISLETMKSYYGEKLQKAKS